MSKEYDIVGSGDQDRNKTLQEASDILAGKAFCAVLGLRKLMPWVDIMTDAGAPISRSKAELETLVKQNGGTVFQSEKAQKNLVVIAERGSLISLHKIDSSQSWSRSRL